MAAEKIGQGGFPQITKCAFTHSDTRSRLIMGLDCTSNNVTFQGKVQALSTRSQAPRRTAANGLLRLESPLHGSGDSRFRL